MSNNNDDEKGKDNVLPFQVIDKRKADDPPGTPTMPSVEDQAAIKECWEKVAVILDQYGAQFMVDAPPIEVKIGEQVMTFNVPVKYGIVMKKNQGGAA